MIGYIDEERVQKLSNKDSMVPLYQKIIKLSEESGELAQAFLKFDGSKNTSASAEGKVEDLLEEVVDCINVSMDIINVLTKNSPALELYTKQLFQAKLDKWESKQESYEKLNTGNKDYLAKEGFMGDVTRNEIFSQKAEEVPMREDGYSERINTKQSNDKQIIKVPSEAIKLKPNPVTRTEHIFPPMLFHINGMKIVPITENFIYKPNYVLSKNQRHYGIPGSWDVVITYEGNEYKSEHYQDYLNGLFFNEEVDKTVSEVN